MDDIAFHQNILGCEELNLDNILSLEIWDTAPIERM